MIITIVDIILYHDYVNNSLKNVFKIYIILTNIFLIDFV